MYTFRHSDVLSNTSLSFRGSWHWKTVKFTDGDYWDLGIESVPALRSVWAEIGAEIVANAKEARV